MRKQVLFIALLVVLTTGINSLMAQPPGGGKGGHRELVDKLTEEQTKKVKDILSKYDSKSISENDAKDIMEALRKERIPRGKGVETAFENAGFNFEEVRKLAPRPSRPTRN